LGKGNEDRTGPLRGFVAVRLDALVQTLGLRGISKSHVPVRCQELESKVERFRTRPLSEASYPYVWLDATLGKAWANGRVEGQAVVIAMGLYGPQRGDRPA